MERLYKIIARLEAKLKPLHDENENLKIKLEELQLDHELALEQAKHRELELQESLAANHRVRELEDQVEALEMLKKLSDELEQDQRDEIARLETQLTQLTQPTEPAQPQNDPRDALQQQLGFLRLELEAAQLDLRAHKEGILEVLHESADFDLQMTRYMLAVYGDPTHNHRLSSLFDLFKHGKVSARKLKESMAELTQDLAARAQAFPRFDTKSARAYLIATAGPLASQLTDANVARAFDDPSLLAELLQSQAEQQPAPALAPTPAPAPAPTPAPTQAQEETELKIKILSEKAARAAHFAAALEEAKQSQARTQTQTQKLNNHIAQLTQKLQEREGEVTILKAAQAPDLDTITFQHTLGLLSDTIKLLHKKDAPFTLEPLYVSPGRSLSAFAGSQVVKQTWDAIDSFQRPTKRAVFIEQMRMLSLIDA